MTKLSERIPKWCGDVRDLKYGVEIGDWLKKLAEYVEFIDRRDRLAYRNLCERLDKAILKAKDESSYEPQTYDEAVHRRSRDVVA